MKILAFSDLHANMGMFATLKKNAKSVDLLLNCGDFTIFGQKQALWLKNLAGLKKPMILIHGNHETPAEVERDCKKFPEFSFIHKKGAEYENILILGYGGGGFGMIDREFEKIAVLFQNAIKQTKKKNRQTTIILITHGPPYKTALDAVGKEHCGNKSYREFVKKNPIDYYFCGHIHETAERKDKINNCTIINPGPRGIIIELKN